MSDEELDAIRRRKLLAMQQNRAEDQKQSQAEQVEAQKQALLKQILSPEARQRLTNLKMIKPEFTEQLELQLIQLAQMGKIQIPLSDAQLKQILIQLQSRKREITRRTNARRDRRSNSGNTGRQGTRRNSQRRRNHRTRS